MKTLIFILTTMLFSLTAFTKSSAIKTSQYVLSQKIEVQKQVNQIIEKQVGKIKVPLDFSKLSCLESGDEVQRAKAPLVRLGVCLVKGRAASIPEAGGSFVIMVNTQGISVQPIVINQE